MTARSLDDLPCDTRAIGVDANCFDFVIEGDRGFHFLYQMSVSNLVLPKISETAIANLANLANSPIGFLRQCDRASLSFGLARSGNRAFSSLLSCPVSNQRPSFGANNLQSRQSQTLLNPVAGFASSTRKNHITPSGLIPRSRLKAELHSF